MPEKAEYSKRERKKNGAVFNSTHRIRRVAGSDEGRRMTRLVRTEKSQKKDLRKEGKRNT